METKVRVLVADDDQSLRDVVSQVLAQEGYEVEAVDSGEAALMAFGQEPFQLVITDIRMGGMDGIELLNKVKEVSSDTQVVIMTSYASLETAIAAMRSGAYDYLMKPFEDLDLVAAIANRAVEKIRLLAENKALVERLKKQNEQLKKANLLFKELAVRDGLTGLHNHRHFQENLKNEVLRCRRHGRLCSVIMIDVDHFKVFNDTNGHPMGDKVLRKLGTLLRDRVRRTDLTARYGGEEFVLLLPETGKEGALRVAESVRRMVEDHPFEGRESQPSGKVTLSIGVATYPDDALEGAGLVEQADQARYRAKQAGRNRVCSAGEAQEGSDEAA